MHGINRLEGGFEMKRKILLASAASALALAGFDAGARAQAVELTLVHPFPDAIVYTKSCKELIGKINQAGEGVVKITVRGGDESIRMFNQPAAVRDGIVDMVCTPAAFYAQNIPENEAVSTSNISPEEARKSGAMEVLDRLHGRLMKMKYLGWIDSGVSFYIYSSEPPKLKPDGLPDFAHVKLRDNPIYQPFFKALGATAHNMPATEVYSALEKGVVNTAAWTSIGLMQLKWDKFLKHRWGPAFFQADIGMVMNLDKWNKLSDKAKEIVQKTVIEHEASSRAARTKEVDGEQAQLKQQGMTFHDFSPEATRKFLEIGWTASKERMTGRIKSQNRPLDDAEAIWKAYHK
jgi:TRAP-type C4-dicarboxylate transport system substrate-binding protein